MWGREVIFISLPRNINNVYLESSPLTWALVCNLIIRCCNQKEFSLPQTQHFVNGDVFKFPITSWKEIRSLPPNLPYSVACSSIHQLNQAWSLGVSLDFSSLSSMINQAQTLVFSSGISDSSALLSLITIWALCLYFVKYSSGRFCWS